MRSPRVLQLIMDSLRYWVLEMHVDGFRFDLASALARELHEVDKLGAFFDIIHQDPVLSQVKLIAEPWDLGEGGYQVGNFPVVDGVERQVPRRGPAVLARRRRRGRRSWRRGSPAAAISTSRAAGGPYASINFVTAHDGFTLHDLVSYNDKHNEANGEDNRDGENHNLSWNCGVEGPTDDRRSSTLRERQRRNLMATLLLSVGRADDQRRRRARPHAARQQQRLLPGQRDQLDALGARRPSRRDFLEFTRRLIRDLAATIRCCGAASSSRAAASAAPTSRTSPGSIRPGREMTDETWNSPDVRCLGVRLNGDAIDEVDERGEPDRRRHAAASCSTPASEPMPFSLPERGRGQSAGKR